MGFPTLCEVVREEREDLEMLRGALECLVLALAHGQPPTENPARPQARHPNILYTHARRRTQATRKALRRTLNNSKPFWWSLAVVRWL